jgi:hypothetical protein
MQNLPRADDRRLDASAFICTHAHTASASAGIRQGVAASSDQIGWSSMHAVARVTDEKWPKFVAVQAHPSS